MPYVTREGYSLVSGLGAPQGAPTYAYQSPAIGKMQQKLKGAGVDIGPRGVDSKYGADTNRALAKWVKQTGFAADDMIYPVDVLKQLGLTEADATTATDLIYRWKADSKGGANEPDPFTASVGPSMPQPRIGTIRAAGSGASPAGTSGGTDVVKPVKPGKLPGAGAGTQTASPEAPLPPVPAEPWYKKYKWWLIGGGSAALGIITYLLVRASRSAAPATADLDELDDDTTDDLDDVGE